MTNWIPFESGGSIGKTGSESGIIVEDIEHVEGARITIERDGHNAPFSVTLGIYGLMFSTHFTGTLEKAKHFAESAKSIIDQVFVLYDTPENLRDETWAARQYELLKELTK